MIKYTKGYPISEEEIEKFNSDSITWFNMLNTDPEFIEDFYKETKENVISTYGETSDTQFPLDDGLIYTTDHGALVLLGSLYQNFVPNICSVCAIK